ncbi:MAG TPA: outer membrane protein assembly factor BamE [Methylophilaceae bacterium]|nr:outer membrane protein assembly factor BamE [Methylophilaceae bacterium]
MRHTIILLALLMCAACSSYSLKPYKMDIQQGNVVTSKMMLQLRPGMNKSQVRFIMGTPLIQDSFHRDRWDYFYQMRKDGKVIEQRRVILEFEGEALKRVRGDVIPAGTGDPAEPSPVSEGNGAGKPQKEKSLMDKLKFWKGDEAPMQKPQAAPGALVAPAEQTPETIAPAAKEPAVAAPPAEASPATERAPAEPAVATPDVTQSPTPERQSSERQPEVPMEQPATGGQAPSQPAASQAPAAPPVAQPAEEAPAKAEPVADPAPKPEAAPKVESKPKPEAKPITKPASKVAPEEEDLPPEGEPGYFERMLEKIGF